MTAMFARASGLLLHITSLPGGRLGPAADEFVQFCEAAGQRWWQLLPVGPPGYGESPYAALSAVGAASELLAGLGGPRPRVTRGAAAIFRREWAYSSRRAERTLRWSSRLLAEGIPSTLEDLRAGGGIP